MQVHTLMSSIIAGNTISQLEGSSNSNSDSTPSGATTIRLDHPDLEPIVTLFGKDCKALLQDRVDWACGNADIITQQINNLLPFVEIELGRDAGSKVTLAQALDQGVVERPGLELKSASVSAYSTTLHHI